MNEPTPNVIEAMSQILEYLMCEGFKSIKFVNIEEGDYTRIGEGGPNIDFKHLFAIEFEYDGITGFARFDDREKAFVFENRLAVKMEVLAALTALEEMLKDKK